MRPSSLSALIRSLITSAAILAAMATLPFTPLAAQTAQTAVTSDGGSGGAGDTPSHTPLVVRQIIDVGAKTHAEMFRFSPKVTRINVGEVIRFTGSTGRHTVTLIKRMAPEGARGFDIRGKPEMDVRFDQPGVYGLRCRVHGRHGMVMLVAVGQDWPNRASAAAYAQGLKPAEAAVFETLFQQLDRPDLSTNN